MKLPGLSLYDPLAVEVAVEVYRALILIEYLLVLLVLILLLAHLVSVIFPHAKDLPLVIQIEAVLEPD